MDKSTVLIVDDNETMRGLMVDWLSGFFPDWCFTTAESGEEAYQLACVEMPDIILMDIGLPGMDGFATARKIVEYHQSSKIIMVSADEEIDYQLEVKSSGAVAFLTKTRMFNQLIPLLISLGKDEIPP